MDTEGRLERHPMIGLLVGVLMVAAVLAAISLIGVVLGTYGLDLLGGETLAQPVMHLEVEIREPVDLGDILEWSDGTNGTVDAATGLPPVELGGRYTGNLSFWGPSSTQKLLYVLYRSLPAVLGLVGIGLILKMLGSLSQGSPFTSANERRMWMIAALIGIGGSLYSAFAVWFNGWMIENSAAASHADSLARFEFLPIVAGGLVAILTYIWRNGIALEYEVEGMV